MGLADGPDDAGVGRIGFPRGLRRHRRRQGPGEPKSESRAGRNLPMAFAVSVILGMLVLLSVLIGPVAWYPLVAATMAAAMWEVLTRLRERGYHLPTWALIGFGQVIVWISWPFGAIGVLGAFAVAAVVVMFGQLFHHGRHAPPQNYLRDAATGIFVLVWIPLFGSFAAMLSLLESPDAPSGFYIITFMLCVVASDTGGYATGVLFGTRPMAPAISPKKTWEGFAGSMLGGTVIGALTFELLLEGPWWLGVLMGAALVVCSSLGDLVESQFKRELGIKDMSSLLPGHGGFMDRLDGMLPSAVVTWLFLSMVSWSVW